jgi:signal recognition particle subunit SEC65
MWHVQYLDRWRSHRQGRDVARTVPRQMEESQTGERCGMYSTYTDGAVTDRGEMWHIQYLDRWRSHRQGRDVACTVPRQMELSKTGERCGTYST